MLYKFRVCGEIVLGTDGWLAPNGNFYPCKSTEHDESAIYLVENVDVMRHPVNTKFKHRYEFEEWKKLSPRDRLKKVGFILINGPVLRSEDALNFSLWQLEKISEAGLKIVSVYDGASRFYPEEVMEYVTRTTRALSGSNTISRLRVAVDKGQFSTWFLATRERTVSSIERFERYPFTTIITTDEVIGGEYLELPREIFYVLSVGFVDEAEVSQGRTVHHHRVVPLTSGRMVWVTWDMYYHDGMSGGLYGDYNNYLTAIVVDPVKQKQTIYEQLDIKSRTYGPPSIKLFRDSGYFADFFADYH